MHEHVKELQRFQKDIDYFELHQRELLQRYPDEWVAIFNGRVVGDNPDVEPLLRSLEERGVPIDKTLLRHLAAKEDVLILVQ